ncbi:MAG TPA: DEAD/DEAH box helicase [Actinomycetota bacterium]|nr:DEAD/DEAH box helicase [Actinomycetota bacterium]
MNPGLVLADLSSRDTYENQIVVHRKLPARPPRYKAPTARLPDEILDALRNAGVDRLFTHQARAIDLLRKGIHTVIATGTASGKTLGYQVPILEALLRGRAALYLSPTKALAQDQLRQVARFGVDHVRAETYDGDTPMSVRASIRRNANLILTNPDMLHVGILPHHELWRPFLTKLAFVVVDESHVLRGIFGSHVALVLRRLRRLAARYKSTPTFALASATIGNPAEHASLLIGDDVTAVTDDGAPTGERHFVFWNPPFLDDESDGRRKSSNVESATMMAALVGFDAKTLAFSKTRVGAELVARYARNRKENGGGQIVAYRAGYLATERREIEAGLAQGRYGGVSATNALELGIDIGDLDAVVLNGFPGTVSSARQQAGRAGRSGQPSLAVVVPQDEPLDQYYAAHPNEFFAKPHEAALVNPVNPHVLGPHVGCAAYELPLALGERDAMGAEALHLAQELVGTGVLRERRGRLFWAGQRPPAPDVDIRSAGGTPFRIVEEGTGRLVGTVDGARAHATVHPGAVYLHQGDTYRVVDLVLDDRVALVEAEQAEEYTQAKTDIDLVVLATERQGKIGRNGLFGGLVEVTEQVVGYQRRKLPGGDVIETHELDLPPQRLVTRAVWYVMTDRRVRRALHGLEDAEDVMLGALHAAEHAGIGILPVFAMCDRWDIGGLSTNFHPDTGDPTIFIYDGYPMGAGISEHAFDVARDHLAATRDHVHSCPCAAGCPSCVQSPKCGNWNEPLHKAGAVRILDLLLAK